MSDNRFDKLRVLYVNPHLEYADGSGVHANAFLKWARRAGATVRPFPRPGVPRPAIKGKLREVRVEGRSLWMNEEDGRHAMRTTGQRPMVRLLPAFDSYVLAYSDRALLMPQEARRQIYHGGQTLPAIVVDGAVVGAWRYESKGKRLNVELAPFEPLGDALRAQAVDEARDIGRFLGLSALVKG